MSGIQLATAQRAGLMLSLSRVQGPHAPQRLNAPAMDGATFSTLRPIT